MAAVVHSLANRQATGRMLDIRYRHEPAESLLSQPGTLAALDFGSAPDTASSDPRSLRIPLQPIGHAQSTPVEHWRVDGKVDHGIDSDAHWASSSDYLFVHLRIDEDAHGGLRRASAHAYRRLRQMLDRLDYPHLLRAWNYLADINAGHGDDERYRHFTMGRAEGIAGLAPESFPAATAIGRLDDVRELIVYALAARHPGRPIENPRQVSAYRYPRQYGPTPPSFARAMYVETPAPQLLISGTASVVGHATLHDQADAQAAETLCNLQSVLAAAGQTDSGLATDAWLKAYLRDPAYREVLAAALHAHGVADDRVIYLHGDICRADLLLEIDGIARL